MNEKALRTFLVGQPRPAKILVRVDGDQTHELAPAGPGRTWASIAQTIDSLDPEAVELYDDTGRLVRATKFGEEETREKAFADGLGVPGADSETARLTHFANLLYRATEFSTTLAFTKMVELFERVNDRSAAIEERLERAERAYHRALNEQIQRAFDDAASSAATTVDPEAPLGDQMVASLLQGAMMGSAGVPPPVPNGKVGKK